MELGGPTGRAQASARRKLAFSPRVDGAKGWVLEPGGLRHSLERFSFHLWKMGSFRGGWGWGSGFDKIKSKKYKYK